MRAIGKRALCLLLCMMMLIGWNAVAPMKAKASGSVAPSVSVGNGFMVALDSGGTLYAWGDNASGTLGNGSTVSSSHPTAVTVPQGIRFVQISAGFDHVLAIASDGEVYAWGANESGQLGFDGNEIVKCPTKIDALSDRQIVAVAAGKQFSLALSEGGQVYAWGNNASLQLGASAEVAGSSRSQPLVISALSGVFATQISADFSSAAIVASDGSVWLWGRNDSFQLGVDNTQAQAPKKLTKSTLPEHATAVEIGERYTMMLFSDARVASLGHNRYGQFANGLTTDAGSAVLKFATLGELEFLSVAAGADQAVGLSAGGAIYTAGLCVGASDPSVKQMAWTELPLGTGLTAALVDAGYANGAAIAQDGTLWTWGENTSGQLGNGSTQASADAVQVVLENDVPFVLGSAPSVQSVALFATASVPAPTYTVTIPASIDIGELRQSDVQTFSSTEFTVTASGVANLFGEQKVVVTLSPASGRFVLQDSDGNILPYGIYRQQSGGDALTDGAMFAEFVADGSVKGWIRVDQSAITQSGIYMGVLNFEIALDALEG